MSTTGVYPGSFNPPTRAHLEIALAAVAEHSLAKLDLAVSTQPLGKDDVEVPSLAHRLAVIAESIRELESLSVVVTDAQLIADIASGYDLVVMGADKWQQVADPAWYGENLTARDEALARLPRVAIAPRPPYSVPPELSKAVLTLADDLVEISSTAARTGRTELMTLAAAKFDRETGAWTDPKRYLRWASQTKD